MEGGPFFGMSPVTYWINSGCQEAEQALPKSLTVLAKHPRTGRVFLMKQKACQCYAGMSEHIWDVGCGSGHLYLGGLVSVETGELRLTREWRVGVRRREKSSAWQSGKLTEGITAVHNTSSGWSCWERKKLVFLEDKPNTKAPHELIPAMPE